jgi:signal transduction histidine kinase
MIKPNILFFTSTLGASSFFLRVAATLILSINQLFAQSDTQAIKNLYDRVLDFDDSKLDSFDYYTFLIERRSKDLGFDKGEILSTRLKGIKAELSGEYKSAIDFYLRCLNLSRQSNLSAYESSALSDLGFIYTNIKNPQKAKEYYQLAAELSIKRNEAASMMTNFTNLGAICNQLGQPDSALFYLDKAWTMALRYPEYGELTFLRNNIGNAWFKKKEWDKALYYFRLNQQENIARNDKDQLWYDVLNMGDVFIELKQYDSARIFLANAMALAKQLGSKRKEADVFSLYSKYYARIKNFESAFETLQKWNQFDTSVVNQETRQTIIEMEERFHAREREQLNKLLHTQIEAEKLRTRQLLIWILAIGGIAIVTTYFFFLIRKKNSILEENNAVIQEQNTKLADLNAEKNSLISIVSHDLGTPFASIRMWNQLLEADRHELSVDQQKAVERIKTSLDSGEALIRNILDVEKEEINERTIRLEPVNITGLIKTTVEDHVAKAEKKNIQIHYSQKQDALTIMTDKQLLKRVFDNLLSNAIKFSPSDRNIYIEVSDSKEKLFVCFRDEGPGIPEGELKTLFSKYGKTSIRPTAGEPSTGLGLSIVKRIMQELNGEVNCESEEGNGSTFTVSLKR